MQINTTPTATETVTASATPAAHSTSPTPIRPQFTRRSSQYPRSTRANGAPARLAREPAATVVADHEGALRGLPLVTGARDPERERPQLRVGGRARRAAPSWRPAGAEL